MVRGAWRRRRWKEWQAHTSKRFLLKIPPSLLKSVLDCILPKVTPEMNASLCEPYTEKEISNALFQIGTLEISNALFQIGPLKVPGTDGFLAPFFQRNWAVLKVEIVVVVLEFFETRVMPKGVNNMVALVHGL